MKITTFYLLLITLFVLAPLTGKVKAKSQCPPNCPKFSGWLDQCCLQVLGCIQGPRQDSKLQVAQSSLCDAIYRQSFEPSEKHLQDAQSNISKFTVQQLQCILCGKEDDGPFHSPGSGLIVWLSYWTYGDESCNQLYPIAKALINKGYIVTDDDKKRGVNYWNPCQKIKGCLLNKNCP